MDSPEGCCGECGREYLPDDEKEVMKKLLNAAFYSGQARIVKAVHRKVKPITPQEAAVQTGTLRRALARSKVILLDH
jgi:hypothetical protein